MLRYLVLVLVLVNLAFWAWAQGWLDAMVGTGVRADGQHEPHRLQLQSHAELLVMLPAPGPGTAAPAGQTGGTAAAPGAPGSAVAPAEAAPSTPALPAPPSSPVAALPSSDAGSTASATVRTVCIEAGPFQGGEYPGVEAAVRKTLKPGDWQTQSVAIPGLWLVYMGPYLDDEQLDKKQTELRRIRGLNFEEVRAPASLAKGLSLGRYNVEADAEAALNQLRNRGVRTARVVNARPAMTVQLLRVPAADEAMQVKLSTLKMPQDKGFVACRT
jgi:hypothetical protein